MGFARVSNQAIEASRNPLESPKPLRKRKVSVSFRFVNRCLCRRLAIGFKRNGDYVRKMVAMMVMVMKMDKDLTIMIVILKLVVTLRRVTGMRNG